MPDIHLRLVETSIVHAKVLATAHSVCFETSWSVKDFQELLALPTSFGFLAQIKLEITAETQQLNAPKSDQKLADILGFVLCSTVKDECEILTIGVLPKWRRRRVGYRLLQQVVEQAENLGAREIFLEVAENNMSAHELYSARGFKAVGRRPNYYRERGGRVDAVVLSKTIFSKSN